MHENTRETIAKVGGAMHDKRTAALFMKRDAKKKYNQWCSPCKRERENGQILVGLGQERYEKENRDVMVCFAFNLRMRDGFEGEKTHTRRV